MSQDLEEVKTIEQWKWSEMQGLELVSPSPSDPFKTNPSTPTLTPTHLTDKTQQQSPAEAQGSAGGERREMETSAASSSSETKKEGSNNGSGEKPGDVASVGFGELFRFADGLDYVLMGIGSLGALVHGCSLPIFLRFFADLVNSFGSNANDMDKMMQEVLKVNTFFKNQISIFLWLS